MTTPYDPLDYSNLAKSIVDALLDKEPGHIPNDGSIEGAGVYALYYFGGLEFYGPIASAECERPIYVGKAVPAGARRGGTGQGGSNALCRRLIEHGKSIDAAENLKREDFLCRYLVVVPVWISLAERFLINHFRPVWNVHLDGFGNHPPGRGRSAMRRPRWDIVHPGRPWAATLTPEETPETVVAAIHRFLQGFT